MLWDRLTSTVAGVGSGSSRRSSPSTAGSSTTSATTKGSTTFSGPASSSSSRSDTSTALSSSPTPPYNGHHNSSASKLPPDSASNWQHISNSSFSVAPLRVRKSASFAQLPGNGHRGAGEQAGSVGASWGRDSDYSFGPPPRASTTNLRLDAYGLGGGASHHYPQVARPPPQRRSPPQRPPTWELHQLDYRSQQSYQQQLGFGGPPLGRASREYLRGSIGGGGPPER